MKSPNKTAACRPVGHCGHEAVPRRFDAGPKKVRMQTISRIPLVPPGDILVFGMDILP
jgi:hypothetical protein